MSARTWAFGASLDREKSRVQRQRVAWCRAAARSSHGIRASTTEKGVGVGTMPS